jgi:uncharacterized protein (TIGR03118 family)
MFAAVPRRRGALVLAVVLPLLAAGIAAAAGPNVYTAKTLVTNASDASLVNGWGITAGPTTPWWVSDNGTNLTTLYGATGNKIALTVSVPGGPTGTVFNGNANAFKVTQGSNSAAARFIFATEAGTILGWASTVSPSTAIAGADRSAQGSVYKGLAILNDRLYAADFHNARVDVFDSSYSSVTLAGGFADPKIPKGWAPFGIQALNGNIFVTYAKQDSEKKDEVAGPGLGYVDEYSPDGALIARVAKKGGKHAPLNAPWGLAMAPAGFGAFEGDLLVGNFGDGRISAYQERSPGKWVYKGQLRSGDGEPLAVDGLWGIAFGNGAAAGPTTSLYFAAGPGDEKQGAFGVITAS